MPNPCNNGGSCELNDREVGGYECTCGDGYTGKSCKMDVKECEESKRIMIPVEVIIVLCLSLDVSCQLASYTFLLYSLCSL